MNTLKGFAVAALMASLCATSLPGFAQQGGTGTGGAASVGAGVNAGTGSTGVGASVNGQAGVDAGNKVEPAAKGQMINSQTGGGINNTTNAPFQGSSQGNNPQGGHTQSGGGASSGVGGGHFNK